MTAPPISPLSLPTLPADPGRRTAGGVRGRLLTMARLADRRAGSTVYDVTTVDRWGRLVARTCVATLSWQPGTRVTMREVSGLVVVTANEDGTSVVTRQGHLRLPLAVRRWCALPAGTRVLVTADPEAARLVVHPAAALDSMVTWLHGQVFGGEPA